MLSMQALKENKTVRDIIEVSTNRINSMAMVHSMLYVSEDIENINAKKFLEKLSNYLKNNADHNVHIKLNIKELELPLNEIIPLGLIVNELLTNSFKYAFKETSNPKINIVFKIFHGNAIFTYHDNGMGYALDKNDNMGLKLIELNVKQLKGTLKIKNKNGLGYKISYKRKSNV
jgi:two-component sensor histidine kinase